MTNIELKILKTDQNSYISVKNEISAQKQLDFNKKVGTVCDLGISTEKQLKIFLEKLKKLGTHCDSQNFTKCLQKSIKKWIFDLAWFVIQGNAQKIEEKISIADNEIDELVYKLYGITEDERKVIEEENT